MSVLDEIVRPRWVLCKQDRRRLQVDSGVNDEGLLVGGAECKKCHQTMCATGMHLIGPRQPGVEWVMVSRPGFPPQKVPVCREQMCGRLWEECTRARIVWLVYPDSAESEKFVALFTERARGDADNWVTIVAQHMLSLHERSVNG